MFFGLINIFHWLDGVVVSDDTIRVRQKGGWVTIPRADIYAVKFPRHQPAIVRLRHGPRILLVTGRMQWKAFERLHKALTVGMQVIKPLQTYEQPRRKTRER